jgi:methionine-rich copper-binding protein CopC
MRWAPLALLTLLPLIGSATAKVADHLYLEAEFPKADTTITSPTQIVLYFSQEPLRDSTHVHLFDAANREIKIGAVEDDPNDPFVYAVNVPTKLPAGVYNVNWYTWSDDEPGGLLREGGWKFKVIDW